MKTIKTVAKRIITKQLIVFLALAFSGQVLMAVNQIDIGIFTSGATKMEIKIRPDFTINSSHYISEIRYTVRYLNDPAINITALNPVAPYNIGYAGPAVVVGIFKYQTFIVQPAFVTFGTTINPGEEVLVSSFMYNGAPSAYFQIIDDTYTISNNINYFFEIICDDISGPCTVVGGTEDVTGIIYQDYASIPVSNWAIFLGIGLIFGFVIIRFRRVI
ncbi:MAG: hypothetical protein Q8M66_04360 [Actinomycetota bacterium]|nr:hypothetical protein [Actinomycetota bacterium]